MPPRRSQEHLEAIARRYAEYVFIFERRSASIRHLPNFQEIYDAALNEWTARPYTPPRLGDRKRLQEFYDEMDEICFGPCSRPEEWGCVIAVHAANAAAQVLIDHDLGPLSVKDRRWVIKRWSDICSPEMAAMCAEAPSSHSTRISASDAVLETLAPHIQAAFNPASVTSQDPFTALLGQKIRYRDKAGTVRECVVVDHGTSARVTGGKYYILEHGDSGKEVTLSQKELEDILIHRVD